MSFAFMSALDATLTQLSDSQKITTHLITRLARLPSHLGSIRSPSSHSTNHQKDDIRLELAAEIHQRLKEQAEAVELLRQEVEDLPHSQRRGEDSERLRLEIGIARVTEDLKLARSSFRRAQLIAKRTVDDSLQQERLLHLTSLVSPKSPALPVQDLTTRLSTSESSSVTHITSASKATQPVSQSGLELSATHDVTLALRRTHALLSSSLSQSQFAHETLLSSTEALTSLQTSYSSLSTLLSSSRNLLGTLLRSQKSDTWYLESALYILIGTVIWLIFRRLLYGPLWWFAYLPVKWALRTLYIVFTLFGSLIARTNTTSDAKELTRSSLTLQPSASGSFGTWGSMSASIPVGGGSREPPTATVDHPNKSLIDTIGNMANQTLHPSPSSSNEKHEAEPPNESNTDKQAPDVEGKERHPPANANRQANPKKRMWEEPAEREKYDVQMAKAKADVEARSTQKDEL